tara:strand:+ start:586 stop:933 length:348 start_codon:yes stop_codon:yes gene_type:complete
MNKKGFVGIVFTPVFILIVVLGLIYWYLSSHEISQMIMLIVTLGLLAGVLSNLVIDGHHTFFIAFAIALLLSAYEFLAQGLGLPSPHPYVAYFIWAGLFGAVVSRFSLMFTGVGT